MLDIEKIKRAIETLRPQLAQDGGDIEFIRAEEDGRVFVKLHGACGSCPMATMTLKEGVEVFLKENIPGVTSVEQEF
ncbi:MAG: NifU family protein [Treponemataceae bacterium]